MHGIPAYLCCGTFQRCGYFHQGIQYRSNGQDGPSTGRGNGKGKYGFPASSGCTEAGDGEDGRIKSSLGIGALLADGLGDTIRVSLSEAPENEIPVARKLVDYILTREGHPFIPGKKAPQFNYLSPGRRKTKAVRNIGGDNPPVVIAERLEGSFETNPQFKPDYIYCGGSVPNSRDTI